MRLLGLQIVPGAPGGIGRAPAGSPTPGRRDQQRHLRPAGVRRLDRPRPAGDHARQRPADRAARQGRAVRLRGELRPGRADGSAHRPGVDAVLDAGTEAAAAAGFSARSGYLTSPTFGGISWLAHSTLQSGLWIDSQLRYNQLVASDRFTLSDAFRRAGWRTVGDVPSNYEAWPEGTSFYHYDQLYDAHNVGYRGPGFSYAQMPDQYILSALQRLELAKPGRAPVMAEVDLVSSHTPWAPLPDHGPVGCGGRRSVFDGMPAAGRIPGSVWSTDDGIKAAYGQSIQYSLTALTSFVTTYPDPNLVLVMLGDHQPASVVSGTNPRTTCRSRSSRTTRPCSTGSAAGAGPPGLRPADDAPVWPMDAFRNKFLAAFGS